MSKFVVDLGNKTPESDLPIAPSEPSVTVEPPKERGKWAKTLKIAGIAVVAVLLVGAIAGYIYWQSLKSTPQYSLALLVDAARRDDQKAIDELVDTDAVVDDFMPQLTAKAIEL